MKQWIYCKECHRWLFIDVYTANRCLYCGSINVTVTV